MTTDQAPSTILGLGKLNRVFIHLSERDRSSDVFVLIGCVDVMTRFAASTFSAVNMQVVQVLGSVSEICQGSRFLVACDISVMAFKAQGVQVLLILIVEFRREIFNQQSWVDAAVWLVAS